MKKLLFVVGTMLSLSLYGTIIPADRIYPWQGNVGVPGGIPNRTVIFANVKNAPYNAAGNGVTDDTAAIQAALNACPSNQVVYIPTGTYNISSTLQVHTGCTVRGDGPGLTVIDSHGSGAQVFAIGDGAASAPYINPDRNWGRPLITPVNITAGTSLGSSSITVSSAAGITIGQLMNIDVLNDTNGVIGASPIGIDGYQVGAARDSQATRCLGQVVLVTGVSGNTITFDPPLMWYMTNAPQAVTFATLVTMAGIENLTVNDNNNGSSCMISLGSVSYCWIKNVESEWSDEGHFVVVASARCEIRDSYMHDSYTHVAGGFEATSYIASHSSGILFENNIIRRLHAGLFPNSGGGNVFAYNFVTNQFDSGSPTWQFNDIEVHSSHPMMNLFEGNVMTGVSGDGIWGTASHFTFLRNYITAQNGYNQPITGRGAEQPGTFTRQTQNNVAIGISGFATNKYWNVVGNVLGSSGMVGPGQNGYYMTISPAPQSAGQGSGVYCFMLGYEGAGDICGCASGDNNLPWLTLINHGNWDAVSQSQTWSNNISDRVIPQSYYLSGKPVFFGNMTWPPINPATGNTNLTTALIPAQYRWIYGTNPPAGTIIQAPIAQASAAPTNGPAPLAVSFSSAGSYDPAGVALSYNWTFGDGATSTSPNPSHTYQNAGSYTASLAVSDGANMTTSPLLTVTVNSVSTAQLPVAVASANPMSGTAPLTVSFSSAGSQGSNLVYNWTFGDGSKSTAANPGHTYQAAGTYSAQLQVTSGTNAASSSVITITVAAVVAQPPAAVATATPTSGIAPLSVVFSSSGSSSPQGTPLTYSWTFGDGSTSTTPNPSHVYLSSGTYSAQLVVSDGTNSSSSSVLIINAASAGPVAAYGFEEGSGSTTADDSGNGNTGTIIGATWTTGGRYGNALSFGTNSFVSVSNSASLDLTLGLTLEGWVYPTSLNGWMNLVYKPIGSSAWSYVLQGATPSGEVPSLYVSPASHNVMAPSPVPLNTWSHVAGTYDGTTMSFYVNGVLVSSQPQTGAITPSTDPLSLGGNPATGQNWNGLIDELRIYNRALSASEIQTDMNTPVSQRPPAPTGLHVVGP